MEATHWGGLFTYMQKVILMNLQKLLNIMDTLLGENGCPWDKEQTHESLRQYLLEECYETIEAIDNRDIPSLKEELGDVLLQVVFHAKIAEKAGLFNIEDIIDGISDKLVSRHTHIFGDDKADTPEEVLNVWEANKQNEKNMTPAQAMRDVPKALPALTRAAKVLKKDKSVKPTFDELLCNIQKSLEALKDLEMPHFDLFGKILLQMVGLSAFLEVNAEFSLTNALEGFITTNSVENPAI